MMAFSKEQRLLRRVEFSATMDGGTKFVTPHVVLIARRSTSALARVGFIVSKKVGGSVERNLVKRRLREIYRTLDERPQGIDLVVIARGRALDDEFVQLSQSFRQGLQRLCSLIDRDKQKKLPPIAPRVPLTRNLSQAEASSIERSTP